MLLLKTDLKGAQLLLKRCNFILSTLKFTLQLDLNGRELYVKLLLDLDRLALVSLNFEFQSIDLLLQGLECSSSLINDRLLVNNRLLIALELEAVLIVKVFKLSILLAKFN